MGASAARRGGAAPAQAVTAAQLSAERPPCTLGALARILQLETLDVGAVPSNDSGRSNDLFRGHNLREGTFSPRVFGGQLIGQALVAASRTVPDTLAVHSLHAYFLLPGDVAAPFIYQVQRTRDGRSFATRHVTAQQHGQPVFEMTASFQRQERGFEHAAAMPADAPPPEAVMSQAERFALYGSDTRVPERMRRALAQRAALPFPLDLRLVDPVDKVAPQARPARQLAWMRAPEPLGDDPALHRCVVAYGSDFALLETALLPHATAVPDSKLVAASIDHAMWFHMPFRADEWLLYEIESPAASGGRGLSFGRLFNAAGQLVASVAQEGLIRHASNAEAAAAEPLRSKL